MPKERSPDDVHDIMDVMVGRPYRGQVVTNIETEKPIDLPNERVKVRRLITLDNGIIVIEDTVHDRGEVYDSVGNLLPIGEIKFPKANPADFTVPAGGGGGDDEDEETKKKKQELLRKKAKEMLRERRPSLEIDDDYDGAKPPLAAEKEKPAPPPEITVQVQLHRPDGTLGKRIPIALDPKGSTIGNLKDRLERDHGIPKREQILKHDGDPLDQHRTTLDQAGIGDGDVVDLFLPAQIKVKTPDGELLPVSVDPARDTPRDVKQKVASDHGVPTRDRALRYKGKPLDEDDDGAKPLRDFGIRHGDVVDLVAPKPPTPPSSPPAKKSAPAGGDRHAPDDAPAVERVKMLGPNSVWVYPTAESAPERGEPNNLQGIWAVPPGDGDGDEPVEVNVHPKNKEPANDGKTIHGPYGYINGAKPDADGIVDPANVIFYPPDAKDFRPDFEQVGWWSSPNSKSETTISWRFEGADMVYTKKQTITFMGNTMTFESEFIK